MKRILLYGAIAIAPTACAMELNEIVSPRMSAEVIKVPAIAALLAAAKVLPPGIKHVAWGAYECTVYRHNQKNTELQDMSPNYYTHGKSWPYDDIRNHMYNIREILNERHNKDEKFCQSLKIFIDGPNARGTVAAFATDYLRADIVVGKKKSYDVLSEWNNQSVWATALSEDDRFVVSSMRDGDQCALLSCYKAKREMQKSKILFFPTKEIPCVSIDVKQGKKFSLTRNNFHLFKKLSFITNDILIGLDQQGELYSILPHFNDPKRYLTLNHLVCRPKNARYIVDFAVDLHDKHRMVLVDNNDIMYFAQITADKLRLKKIKDLKEVKESAQKLGLPLRDLCTIRLQDDKGWVIFNTDDLSEKKITCQFELVYK